MGRDASGRLRPLASLALVDDADVLGLRALRAVGDLKLDLVVLLQVPVAGAGDRAEVDEDVGTGFLRDEPEALVAVEPLDGAGSHGHSLHSWPDSDHGPCGRAAWCRRGNCPQLSYEVCP